jgi:hypothetical protein
MTEPFMVSQCAEPMTDEQRKNWILARSDEANARGAKLARVSLHESVPNLLLFEAWDERVADQGEQRWALTSNAA